MQEEDGARQPASSASEADAVLQSAKVGTKLAALSAGHGPAVERLAEASHRACLVWNEVHAAEVCCGAFSDLRHYVQPLAAAALEAAAGAEVPTAVVGLGGIGIVALAAAAARGSSATSTWLVQPRRSLREAAALLWQWHHLPAGRLRTVPCLSESIGEAPFEKRWVVALEGLEAHEPAKLLGALQQAMHLASQLGAEVRVEPQGLRLLAQPAEIQLHDVAGFDLSEVHRRFTVASSASHFGVSGEDLARATAALSAPEVVLTLWAPGDDLTKLPLRRRVAASWLASRGGACEAAVFWFEVFVGGRWLDSRSGPGGRAGVQLLPAAVPVREGERIRGEIAHNGSRAWFDIAGSWGPDVLAQPPAYLPFWHVQMLVDVERNSAYERALQRHCRRKRVAEIGSGSGLLLMMAMRAGAVEAVGCEINSQTAETAQQVLRQNGFGNGSGVTLHHADARDLELPRRYDVLLAELMDYTGLGESLAGLFAQAKPRWLAPGGRVIPSRLQLYAFLIEWPFPRVHPDVDLSPLEPFISNARYAPFCSMGGTDSVPAALNSSKDWCLMSDVVKFLDIDLQALTGIEPEGPSPVIFHATKSGIVNAVAWFFVCHLDDDVSICTAPVDHPAFEHFHPVRTHWYQAMQAVGPVVVVPGQEVNLGFAHNGMVIDWFTPRDVAEVHSQLVKRLFERSEVPAECIDATKDWFMSLWATEHRDLPPVREGTRAVLEPVAQEAGSRQLRWLLQFISQLGEFGHSTNCADRLLGLCCSVSPGPSEHPEASHPGEEA